MSLSIHLHGLHFDAQHGQTWHLPTRLRSGERTGRLLPWPTTLLLPTLLSDSQVSNSLVIHGLRWTVSGQVKAHVVLTCTNCHTYHTYYYWYSITHSLFHSGLNPSFSANPPYPSLSFFSFRFHNMDFPDCLLLLLSISVFLLFSFSVFTLF